MAEALSVQRACPLASRRVAASGIDVMPAAPAFRLNLRCNADAAKAVGKALGLSLPQKPKQSASKEDRVALWLGPDEWLIIDESSDPFGDLLQVAKPHSAVDVSHRNTAIEVSGARAADLIAHGCPQNLSVEAFPVGGCSRTVFGKAEIVLCRVAEDRFRIEVWRSFSDYVFAYLADAARDYR